MEKDKNRAQNLFSVHKIYSPCTFFTKKQPIFLNYRKLIEKKYSKCEKSDRQITKTHAHLTKSRIKVPIFTQKVFVPVSVTQPFKVAIFLICGFRTHSMWSHCDRTRAPLTPGPSFLRAKTFSNA